MVILVGVFLGVFLKVGVLVNDILVIVDMKLMRSFLKEIIIFLELGVCRLVMEDVRFLVMVSFF